MDEKISREFLQQLKDLVAFETVSATPNNFTRGQIEKALNYIVKNTIKGEGNSLIVRKIRHNGSPSLIISTCKTLKPDVGFLAHIDVVPADKKMFKLKIKGGKLMGRGVADMKFALPVFMELMHKASQNNYQQSLTLFVTSDEELGGQNGARYLAENLGYRPKLLFVPDGGNHWQFIEKAKGALHLEIEFFGKSAHASKPWEGVNAIDKLIKFVALLSRQYVNPEKEQWNSVTMNLGKVNGGKAINQVAEKATVGIDFRYPEKKDRKEILETVEKHLPQNAKITIKSDAAIFNVNSHLSEIKKFLNELKIVIGKKVEIKREYGATDGRYFNQYEVPCIVVNPPCDGFHSSEEWLSLKGMYQYYQALDAFLKSQ